MNCLDFRTSDGTLIHHAQPHGGMRTRTRGRKAFEVRGRVAGCGKSGSSTTRALVDSYRAELIRAARQGRAYDPSTGDHPAAGRENRPQAAC
jgi:hypothetical protein